MATELQVLIDYIRAETGHSGALGEDDDLLATGVLDSFNIVSLAMYAQERFGVEFEAEDLVRSNLARLSSLVNLIRTRREAPIS
ncbi:MAG TPA: acyl carrier protein [Casimicrobiaceae bacterium]|nr:acyl carrier protein [Casimicrobiaceae bacterium]